MLVVGWETWKMMVGMETKGRWRERLIAFGAVETVCSPGGQRGLVEREAVGVLRAQEHNILDKVMNGERGWTARRKAGRRLFARM